MLYFPPLELSDPVPILGAVIGLLALGWSWRELVWCRKSDMQLRIQKYLVQEADRGICSDKVVTLDAGRKRRVDEFKRCSELWDKFWVKLFETKYPGLFNPAQDRMGRYIWQQSIEAFIDLRRFRGSFAPGQVKHLARLVLAVKRAVRNQERAYAALSPVGEIEFDGEGGFKVSK